MDEKPENKFKIEIESSKLLRLTPKQEWLCKYLNALNGTKKFSGKILPSELVTGALSVINNRVGNPDWMAQAAHSFRELFYGPGGTQEGKIFNKVRNKIHLLLIRIGVNVNLYKNILHTKTKRENIQEVFEILHQKKRAEDIAVALNRTHVAFTKIAHHFHNKNSLKETVVILKKLGIPVLDKNVISEKDFLNLISVFENIISESSLDPLNIHQKLDQFIVVPLQNRNASYLNILFSLNIDAKRYFYSIANDSWLQWLGTNGFFSDLKKPAEDQTKYGFHLPELDYLTQMAEKNPIMVASTINSIPVSKETFNPEVVHRFFWIIGQLPAAQIKLLLPKILDEDWIQLMSPFNESGYGYKMIVDKLRKAGDFEAINKMAEIVLVTRTREDLAAMEQNFVSDRLFYLRDISETDIFEALVESNNNRKEESLKIILQILSRVVKLGTEKEDAVFAESEPFYLLDVSVFDLELDGSKRTHPREDIQNLVTTARLLARDVFSSVCGNESEARRLYVSYIASLPDSKTLYRLSLYVATLCPALFTQEIKKALFRVFEVGDQYSQIDGGAEYHQGLMAGFAALDKDTKREYVGKVFDYYGASFEDKEVEKWRRHRGLEVMICIRSELTEGEASKSESIFGKFPEDGTFKPHPDMMNSRAGFISHKSPVNLTDFSVADIPDHLKTDLSPSTLGEKFKDDDFFTPRGAEGLGDELKKDFKLRPTEYFKNLIKFFDRELIHPSYIYSLLWEVEDTLRNNGSLTDDQSDSLLEFFSLIRASGEQKEFEKTDGKRSWLADWITVHKIMADVLLSLLGKIGESEYFKKNRESLLALVKYLLSIKSSPDLEYEDPKFGEPSHVALNSVRGQAYRAFVQFTYNDGKALADDVKKIFEWIIDTESSTAVRFNVGQFFAAFYFRDKPFVKGLLPEIFPKDQIGKEKLYFATWEGYLAGVLYDELFKELEEYYAYAITVKKEQYPDRKYLKGLDETLSAHMALAYAQFELKIEDLLFQSFWKTPSEVRHYEFVSFTGKHYLTRGEAGDEWMAEHKVNKGKIIDFWTWILSTDIPLEAKTFSGFGFWVNPDKEIVDDKIVVEKLAASLKKSNGVIDWEYGLMERIDEFAKINPEKTLEIITSLLILNDTLNPSHHMYFDAGNKIGDPLKIIYQNEALKKPVKDLINTLIEKGSSAFWGLKDIL